MKSEKGLPKRFLEVSIRMRFTGSSKMLIMYTSVQNVLS